MSFRFPQRAIHSNGRKLIIDHMTSQELSEMFRMVSSASQTGNGFGEDEFLDEEDFRTDLKNSETFVFKDGCTQKLIACLGIGPSVILRTYGIKDTILVIAEDERFKGLSSFCVSFGIDYSCSQNYDGLISDIFTTNEIARKMIRRFGFVKVGHISISGKIKDQGFVGSEFWFYDCHKKRNPLYLSFAKDGLYAPYIPKLSKL